MAVSPKNFEKWAIHLLCIAKFSHGATHDVWLVQANLNFQCYINDLRSVIRALVGVPLQLSTSASTNLLFKEKDMNMETSPGMVALKVEQSVP